MNAQFADTLDPAWSGAEVIRLERRASGETKADRYVLVDDGGRRLRCDIFVIDPEAFPFEDVRVWRNLLVIGYGSTIYCVDIETRATTVHELDSYFGSFHVGEGYCLAASGAEILRLGGDGAKIWESDAVGVDGVIFGDVDGDTIRGEGQWDPPDIWLPFEISLATGRPVQL